MNATPHNAVLQVRGVRFGEGTPKIIIPLTDAHEAGLLAASARIAESPAEVVEWRVDRFSRRNDHAAVLKTAERIHEVIGERPLLFTIRTRHEGSDWDPAGDGYRDLISDACASGHIDMVDVQYLNPAAQRCFAAARAHRIPVVASHHDFGGTPPTQGIIDRLEAMSSMGADICKIAVLPRSPSDVLSLLNATTAFSATSRIPLITMAMGPLGGVTRLAGQVFGSCATFATLGDEGSAPGQLPLDDVRAVLEIIGREL